MTCSDGERIALVKVDDSVRPHRQQPTRLPQPWDSPGKNTGVGCHFLLQCMKVKSESEVAQSCPTLRDPMDCSLPGSSTHEIFQPSTLRQWSHCFSVFLPTNLSSVACIAPSSSVFKPQSSKASTAPSGDEGHPPHSHLTLSSGLVRWDDPEGWYGEGGGRGPRLSGRTKPKPG